MSVIQNPHPRRVIMIYLDGLPDPPEHEGWWSAGALAVFISQQLAELRHLALEMRDAGGTKEDFEYMAELRKAIALRAWNEISRARPPP